MQTELVERAMRGDHDAFADLASAAWSKLYATAGFILGDEGSIHEAVQATLIRAWQDLPGLRDPARFDAWLYRIAINACRDEARRRQRGRQREIALDGHHAAASADSIAWLAEQDEMDRALARLTPDQRVFSSATSSITAFESGPMCSWYDSLLARNIDAGTRLEFNCRRPAVPCLPAMEL